MQKPYCTCNSSSVREIGDGAFKGCLKLSSVTLPVALKNIGRTAFEGVNCSIVRRDVGSPSSNKSKISTTTSSTSSKKASSAISSKTTEKITATTTSSVSKSIKSSDKKEPTHAKQTTKKMPSAVKTPNSAPKTKPVQATSTKTTQNSLKTNSDNTATKPKFTPIYIPNQSTRIRLVKEYYSHPLRSEYEQEKNKLYKKNPKRFIPTLVILFPWVMIIGYGIIFFNVWESFIVVALGIINLFACLCSFGWSDSLKKEFEKDTTGVDELKAKYQQKGLYEVTESELLSSKCGEYDSFSEEFVCSATGEYLNYIDYNWCQTPGNCKYCRKFVQAYVGSTEYWSCEFKR